MYPTVEQQDAWKFYKTLKQKRPPIPELFTALSALHKSFDADLFDRTQHFIVSSLERTHQEYYAVSDELLKRQPPQWLTTISLQFIVVRPYKDKRYAS